MDELLRLRRERYKKMINLLPDMVAEKQAPAFFYQTFQRFIDWDEINLNKYPVKGPSREDMTKKYAKIVQHQRKKLATINFVGKQKQLKVDNTVETLESDAGEKEDGNPIAFQPYSLQRTALYDKGCLTCGKSNIIVRYHLDRHICLRCRQKITTLDDDPVVIFQDDDGEVVVVGLKEDEKGKKMYFVQYDELKIFGYRCYVTFSDPDELIILLHDSLNENKMVDISKSRRRSIFIAGKPPTNEGSNKSLKRNYIFLNKRQVSQQTENKASFRSNKSNIYKSRPSMTQESMLQSRKSIQRVSIQSQ